MGRSWRVFRHESGREAGPPAWAYVALFSASLLIGIWSARQFGAVVLWPANGILLAAFLQLHRRKAITVMALCFAINLASNVVRGDGLPFLWLNPVLNILEVVIAGVIARRVCGAALDLRRPKRLMRFAVLAVTPAVLTCTLIIVTVAANIHGYSAELYGFTFKRYFNMQALGLLVIAPLLLLLARSHRFGKDARLVAGPRETAILFLLLAGATLMVFGQSNAPTTYLIFPALLLLVFRVSPTGSALAVLMITLISGAATLTGHGPVTLYRLPSDPELNHLPDLVRQLNVLYGFLLALIAIALPVSTAVSEHRRMITRLEVRTKAAQAARRRAEAADTAKSRFLALMSHEMRTPLHGVVGYAEILSRRAGLAREARRQVAEIQRSGSALLTLVEDVLEVSRGNEMVCFDTVDPTLLLEEVVAVARDAADARDLPIHVRVHPGAEQHVIGDQRRMRQILHRLLSNAVKFTCHGEIVVSVAREGPLTVFRVADTGSGVDPAFIPRLFEPFAQADDSISRSHVGAGLGLPIARRMAGAMGGVIALEESSPCGSTFVVRLPLAIADAPAPAASEATTLPASASEAGSGRVLIVDDHPTNREVARLMLSPLGCEIVEAADGIEAVEMASAMAFDLILMDVRMPRMDGLAASRAIRAKEADGPRTPILAVTADAMPEDAARCLAAGMDGHVAKPLTHASLFAAIDAAMTATQSEPIEGVAA
jgi:signal transduction histidine kinase/ActR/RegA family two-component response regulator